MQVITRGTMPDGTGIQIEDWSKSYSFEAENGTVAAYPIATRTDYDSPLKYPQCGQSFRLAMRFTSAADAASCFAALQDGSKQLDDFVANFERPTDIKFLH
ncbi:MAG: hypothetical protein K2M47_00715 [Clostridiales bacterium]|nr:hypothetical protein [Clostridiales bacterium]MDE6200391.1 hypothetical protein [Clostridiales bacterium]